MRARRSAARSSFASTSPRTLRLAGELPDPQDAFGPVGLHVGSAEEPVAGEQRQDVVAVDPLVLALVHLDQMLEAEQPLEQRPVPDQVVERRQEHRRGGRPVELGGGEDVERRAAVVDLHLAQLPLGDERLEVLVQPRLAALQPPVLADRRLGQRTARLDRQQRRTCAASPSSVGTGASSHCCGITRSVRS